MEWCIWNPERKQQPTKITIPSKVNFQNKHKWRDFKTTRPALQKMLKGVLHPEVEEK
jgi:Holliday junction resolvase RusA-like endonuclease